MTGRRSCSPVPGLLEDYCAQFDQIWRSLAQRRGFRGYLTGLWRECAASPSSPLLQALGERVAAGQPLSLYQPP